MAEEKDKKEYLTEEEAKSIRGMFKKFLKSYKEKAPEMSDQEWLEQLFKSELPEMTEEEVKHDAKEITESSQLLGY